MTDTGSKSFECALVSTMETYDGPENGNYVQGPAGGPVLVITELVRANQGLSNCSGFYAAADTSQIQIL